MLIPSQVGDFHLVWREIHPDGILFFDIHGSQYLFNTTTKVTTKLFDKCADIVPTSIDKSMRTMCVISGQGIFKNLDPSNDPRELTDIEYYGDMMYNLEAEADLHYFILRGSAFFPDESSDPPTCGTFRIRGSFKRIALVACLIKNTKIQIISDTNPEIYLIGNDMDLSSIEVINDQGVPYEANIIATRTTDLRSVEAILDYVRSDDDNVFVAEEPDNSVISVACIASCLAVAGLVAASTKKPTKTEAKTKTKESLCKISI